jgi:hypothetical protein
MSMHDAVLVELLIPIFVCCVLPITMVWLSLRNKKNETDKRTQIVLAAIEKNPEMDIQDLLKKMAPKERLLKEKLLSKLQTGCITAILGVALLGVSFYIDCMGGMETNKLHMIYIGGGICMAVGIAYLVSYFIGKKMLAKEIEAEEKKLTAEANL